MESFYFLADLEMPLIHSIWYEKYMLKFHSHLTFTAWYEYKTYFQLL